MLDRALEMHYLIYLILTWVLITIIRATAVSRAPTLCQGFSVFHLRSSCEFNRPRGSRDDFPFIEILFQVIQECFVVFSEQILHIFYQNVFLVFNSF